MLGLVFLGSAVGAAQNPVARSASRGPAAQGIRPQFKPHPPSSLPSAPHHPFPPQPTSLHRQRRRRVAKLAQRVSAGLVVLECERRRRDTLSHTYFQNVMHIVFSTKERRKIIPAQMKERLWAYTAGICQHQNIFVHAIGGTEDHIHLLLQFPATVAIADAINRIKTNSSGWMSRETGRFAWQQGYGGFGVSKSNIAAVVRYIQIRNGITGK